MSDNLDELLAEKARREQLKKSKDKEPSTLDNIKGGLKAFGAGVNTGVGSIPAVGTMALDIAPEAVRFGAEAAGSGIMDNVPSMPLTSGYFGLMEKGGMASEDQFPNNPTMFRFGEGFGASAPFGARAGIPGMLTTGTLGGLSNVAGKGLFPQNPLAQAGFSMALPMLSQLGSNLLYGYLTRKPPNVAPPVKDSVTGVDETAGQSRGSFSRLNEEKRVSGTVEGAPYAQEFNIQQADDMEKFLRQTQQFSQRPNLSDKQISDGIWQAFKQKSESMLTNFKRRNQIAFDSAKNSGVDFKSPSVEVNNAIKTIDELIEQFSYGEVKTPSQQGIVKDLKVLRDNLTSKPSIILGADGKPMAPLEPLQKMSLEQLQQNLSSLGEAAYKGTFAGVGKNTSAFADATPGTVKYIARRVLGGLRKDMDVADSSGNAGASALKQAREIFKVGLDELDTFAQKPLTKFFNKTKAEALTPELIVKKMTSLPTSQQNELMNVLSGVRPDLVDNIRAREFTQILDKAMVGDSARKGQARFNLDTALDEIGKLSGDKARMEWLFPTKKEQNEVKAAVAQLQRILQRTSYEDAGSKSGANAMRALEYGVGAATGSRSRFVLESVVNSIKSVITGASNEKLAMLMFDPNGRKLIAQLGNKPNPQEVTKLWQSNSRLREILLGKQPSTVRKDVTAMEKGLAVSGVGTADIRKTSNQQAMDAAFNSGIDGSGDSLEEMLAEQARRQRLKEQAGE